MRTLPEKMSLLKVIGGLLLSAAIGALVGAAVSIIGADENCECVGINYAAVLWGAIIAASYYSAMLGRRLWQLKKAARIGSSDTD